MSTWQRHAPVAETPIPLTWSDCAPMYFKAASEMVADLSLYIPEELVFPRGCWTTSRVGHS